MNVNEIVAILQRILEAIVKIIKFLIGKDDASADATETDA